MIRRIMIDGKLSKCYLWSEYSEFLLELTTSDAHFQMMQCHDKNKDQFLLREQLLLLMILHSALPKYVKISVKSWHFFPKFNSKV